MKPINPERDQVCECGEWKELHPTPTCKTFRFDASNTAEGIAEWQDNQRVFNDMNKPKDDQ